MASISRAEMEAAIRAGGSVLLPSGQCVCRVEDLPTDADLSRGDPAREARARADLQRQMAALQAQFDSLRGPDPATPAAPPATHAARVGTPPVARPSSPATAPVAKPAETPKDK